MNRLHSALEPSFHRGRANRRKAEASVRRGFTMIEMLTTVAILTIALGMMVSLARYVRDRSAQQLTRDVLKELDLLMAQYQDRNGGQLPPVPPILPPLSVATTLPAPPVEAELMRKARTNNEQCVRAIKLEYLRTHPKSEDPFKHMAISVYDLLTLRDAWGSPVVFMAGQHPYIGLAPSREGRDQDFFFSAGPDRRFLTRDDNVYSYESPSD